MLDRLTHTIIQQVEVMKEMVAPGVGALAPGVVGELVEELEGGAVGLEAVGALRELQVLAAHRAAEAGVADAAVEPVIEPVVQVVGLRVGVVHAPAGHDLLAHVGAIVAVGVVVTTAGAPELATIRGRLDIVGEDEIVSTLIEEVTNFQPE